ncbi:MAG: prolipoprotein diacylglyceryl transferase [Alphaproteobacteria bacterium]|nr:prolipoprotein diacylglyceryl transferase [Alphaproteobacteria bacterium]
MAVVINPINPVAFSVFGLPVRWYALAYIAGFVIGYYLVKYLTKKDDAQIHLDKKQMDDLLTYVVMGVIIGGRLGYVLFYNLQFFIEYPLEIFALWHGGMSFHGGFIGVVCSTLLFAKKYKFPDKSSLRNALRILDVMAVAAPIGLFFGRIANFINMEVMGRATDSRFGIIFNGIPEYQYPRHPSPLYEAGCEGILLFIIMWLLYTKTKFNRTPGAIGGLLCVFYAIFRIFCEQFRQPDVQIGFLTSWGLTMGQLLSGVMFIVGLSVFVYSIRQNKIK